MNIITPYLTAFQLGQVKAAFDKILGYDTSLNLDRLEDTVYVTDE